MSDSLVTYLHDHLAGSRFAIELLELLRDRHANEPLGRLATGLLVDIKADRDVLQGIADRARGGTPIIRETVSWVGQKVSELKLRHTPFGTFEALETLSLGVLGKLKLWRALAAIADKDDRLRGVDYDQLAERAKTQHAQVEDFRLQTAGAALRESP